LDVQAGELSAIRGDCHGGVDACVLGGCLARWSTSRARPEILRALGETIYGGPSTFIYIYLFVYIYIVLYKHIIQVNKYMNINYFYGVLHFNIYEINLTGITKTYLVLGIIL
jgi:hypothetical protein